MSLFRRHRFGRAYLDLILSGPIASGSFELGAYGGGFAHRNARGGYVAFCLGFWKLSITLGVYRKGVFAP